MLEGACHCGQIRWRFAGVPASGTICNCSVCRRYAALWAYGAEGQEIEVSGTTQPYAWGRQWLDFHFCPACGCVAYWRAKRPEADGRRWMGVNLRLAPFDAVRGLPLVRHDTETRDDLPGDGRCIGDVGF